MQFPSSKVVFAILASLAFTAALVIGESGMPDGIIGWLIFTGKVFAGGAAVGGTAYLKTETNPPRQLVAAIRARQVG